jgi:hypothetical protein
MMLVEKHIVRVISSGRYYNEVLYGLLLVGVALMNMHVSIRVQRGRGAFSWVFWEVL